MMTGCVICRPEEKTYCWSAKAGTDYLSDTPSNQRSLSQASDLPYPSRSIGIVVPPQMHRFIPSIIGLENKTFDYLTFKSDVELIAFRDLQVGFDRTQRISLT